MSAGFARLPTSLNPPRTDHERVHLDPLREAETPLVRPRRRDPNRPRKDMGDGGGRFDRSRRFACRTLSYSGQQDFETVEIWKFPSAEAAFEHWSALTAAGYGELNAFAHNIGLAIEGSP